jgi:hypothetical protein
LYFFSERWPFGERLSSDVPADVDVQLTRDLVEERHDEDVSDFLFWWFWRYVREISYFAALRLRLRLSLSRVSNSSRLEAAADPADWLLRVSLSGFPHAVARAEDGKAEAVTCRRVLWYRSTQSTALD